MFLANSIEERIREAIATGDFDNLEGAGKPLDLDDYFAAPEDVRMGYSVVKSNKFVPEEIDRLKEIGELKEQIKSCADENKKRNLIKVLNEKTLCLQFDNGKKPAEVILCLHNRKVSGGTRIF